MKALKIKSIKVLTVLLTALCLTQASCKKFVNVDAPSNQLVTATVYNNNYTLQSALAGMYTTFATDNSYNTELLLSFLTGNSADESKYATSIADFDPFINNAITADNSSNQALWNSFYTSIYQANAIIDGVNSSTGGISDAWKTEALAEARFMRALFYFYLVNTWGDVPLALSTSQAVNNKLSRSTTTAVYQQIISDLTYAQNMLPGDYSYASGQRIRPNKYAATALLARVYLYTKDWANAEKNATAVISAGSLYGLLPTASLNGIFVQNNTEAILQFDYYNASGYTQEGNYYLLDTATIPDFQLTNGLVQAFESGDQRFNAWVGSNTYGGATYYYPFKYKNRTNNTSATAEYVTFLRLGEQYLIRAEARAQLNNLNGAAADINTIRTRAGLTNTTAITQANLLLAIEKERRVELFGEYGHRWYDLKRTGRADAVLGAAKSGWKPSAALYPIPYSETLNNKNLTQNPGY